MSANDWKLYLQALKGEFVKLAKLEFLQPDHSVAFALDNNARNKRSGAFIQGNGSLTVNLQNGPRRVATVELANLDGEYEYNVNKLWFGQQVRLSEGLILPNGEEYYIPQGVFYIANPEETLHPSQRTVTLNLTDKWAYLDGSLFGKLDGVYEVPLNSSIFTAIQSVLELPRGNGYAVDDVTPLFTNWYNDQTTTLPDGTVISDLLTPYTYRQDSDSGTYADVVLEMNNMLAGWIGYDAEGRLRLDPSQDDILDSSKPVLWNFSPSERQFLGATYKIKNTDVYNDIIITGEALSEYATIAGRACNYDPSSDTNINIIGKKTYRESASGYATRKQCEDLAVFKLKRQTILQRAVTIESTQMFHIEENKLVTIRRIDKPGAPVERHLITGFTRPIGQTGIMTIEAVSVQDFPVATVMPLPWEEDQEPDDPVDPDDPDEPVDPDDPTPPEPGYEEVEHTLEATVADFSMSSTWTNNNGRITYGPTTSTTYKQFVISGIPDDATVGDATISMTIGSPNTGAAILKVDGNNATTGSYEHAISIPGNGSYSVEFIFKANGSASMSDGNHSGSCAFSNVTVTVTYTTMEPVTPDEE